MWTNNKIDVCWDDKYKLFPYVKQPLTDEELNTWKSQGYTHDSFTGTMYDSRNLIPEWCNNVAKQVGLEKTGFVFYKMSTNDIMPTHIDHFRRYCEVFKIKKQDVYRAIVFLEDWKPGHYFEIDNTAFCNYRAGEYVLWSHDVSHAASNIGIDDRYTLQITGTRA